MNGLDKHFDLIVSELISVNNTLFPPKFHVLFLYLVLIFKLVHFSVTNYVHIN